MNFLPLLDVLLQVVRRLAQVVAQELVQTLPERLHDELGEPDLRLGQHVLEVQVLEVGSLRDLLLPLKLVLIVEIISNRLGVSREREKVRRT